MWTVTSVATGLGLSGGTITTSGTLLVDTSSASILSRERAAATYLAKSDTASMLSAYQTAINGKQVQLSGTGLLSFSGSTPSYNTTSASIEGIISDEVGTDKIVFNTNPTILTPNITDSAVITRDGLGSTTTTHASGLYMQNTTAAANNAQQLSPSLVLASNGWGTTAGTSQPMKFRLISLPQQSTVPSAQLLFQSSSSNGPWTTRASISASSLLSSSGALSASTTITAGTNITATNGNLSLNTAGNKINIATGTNGSVGTSSAMTAGTITISTTAVTASSLIFLTHKTLGGTQGILSVGTIVAGTSFVINSSNAADTGTVNWWIVN